MCCRRKREDGGKKQRRNECRCGVYWFTEDNTGEHDHTHLLTHTHSGTRRRRRGDRNGVFITIESPLWQSVLRAHTHTHTADVCMPGSDCASTHTKTRAVLASVLAQLKHAYTHTATIHILSCLRKSFTSRIENNIRILRRFCRRRRASVQVTCHRFVNSPSVSTHVPGMRVCVCVSVRDRRRSPRWTWTWKINSRKKKIEFKFVEPNGGVLLGMRIVGTWYVLCSMAHSMRSAQAAMGESTYSSPFSNRFQCVRIILSFLCACTLTSSST